MYLITLILSHVFVLVSSETSTFSKYGHRFHRTKSLSNIRSALPFTYISELPKEFDWRAYKTSDGATIDLTTPNLNQHQPHYCGACWAFATVSSLSDRLKIVRKGAWPQIILNPQVLIACGPSYEKGCDGGDTLPAYKWIAKHGLPDETCHNYEARNMKCNELNECMNCDPANNECYALTKGNVNAPPRNFSRWFVDEYGTYKPGDHMKERVNPFTRNQTILAEQVKRMQAEILSRGPIVCGIGCPPSGLLDNYTGGIIHDKTGFGKKEDDIDHDISIIGWGEEKDTNGKVTKYWIIRNSWGSWWGERGFFRIIRGENNLGIESGCDWATMKA